jgi:hypothetical protein
VLCHAMCVGCACAGASTCTLGFCRYGQSIAHSAMPGGATAPLIAWCTFGRHTCIIITCPAVPPASGATSAADRLQPGLYGPLPVAAFDRIARAESLLYLSGASSARGCLSSCICCFGQCSQAACDSCSRDLG